MTPPRKSVGGQPTALTAALTAGDDAAFAAVAAAFAAEGGDMRKTAARLAVDRSTLYRLYRAHPELRRVRMAARGRQTPIAELLRLLGPGAHTFLVPEGGGPEAAEEALRAYCERQI